MTRNKIAETTLRLTLLVFFSIKLVVVTLSQIDLIYSMYSVNELMDNPILILRLNLFIEPLIILLGLIGLFIKRPIGFVFMLLLPSLILTYELIPTLTKYFSFRSTWLPISLAIVFLIITNSKGIRSAYQSDGIKESVFSNIKTIIIGLILSLFMYYFNGRLGLN
ncbi:hypothetical protein [Labilibaculum sp.]|uniref:hypothetical protein n=1 Tax=Labilibaculum sp. TaxID=2060723 RepID=UPI002AA65F2D|nr:hypothetical protein [Labilibaculum sp.]MBN2595753.1 hypothetical protein [Marinifilaceae bacterium]